MASDEMNKKTSKHKRRFLSVIPEKKRDLDEAEIRGGGSPLRQGLQNYPRNRRQTQSGREREEVGSRKRIPDSLRRRKKEKGVDGKKGSSLH